MWMLIALILYALGGLLAWSFCMYHEERRETDGHPKRNRRLNIALVVVSWPVFAVSMAIPWPLGDEKAESVE